MCCLVCASDVTHKSFAPNDVWIFLDVLCVLTERPLFLRRSTMMIKRELLIRDITHRTQHNSPRVGGKLKKAASMILQKVVTTCKNVFYSLGSVIVLEYKSKKK